MPTTYGKLIRNGVNFSHDTAESISYDNTTSGLTATDIQAALDEIASGAGGHNIKNDAGTTLTQRSNLQFKGVYAHDDSTNENTVIETVREMTEQQYGQLSDAEKKGIILTDTEHDTPVFLNGNMVVYDENNTVTQAINNRVSKSGDTVNGNVIIDRINTGTTNLNSVLTLGNNIPVGTVGTSRGIISLYSYSDKQATLYPEDLSEDRYVMIPDKTGTIALTSQLPTIYKRILRATSASFGNIPGNCMGIVTFRNYQGAGDQDIYMRHFLVTSDSAVLDKILINTGDTTITGLSVSYNSTNSSITFSWTTEFSYFVSILIFPMS